MIYAIIAIIAVIIIIAIIIGKKYYSPLLKGKKGEKSVAEILGGTISGKRYVINDLLFETGTDNSCEIDHIFINKYGVWVIETKNYADAIYGNENQQEWVQVLAEGNKANTLYNPIKQNATHIYHISKYLNVKGIFQNVVVFSPNADISHIDSNNVIILYDLPSIKHLHTDTFLTVEKMEIYYNKLLELKNSSTISKREHIKNIRKNRAKVQRGICPRCGGKLVLRNGRYGQFYGCSNFPKCKFKKNIDDNTF